MKKFILLVIVIFCMTTVNRAFCQDLAKTNPKYCKVLSDTGGVKMVLVTLPPGAKLGTHTHPLNFGYVLKGGLYKWTYTNGKTESDDFKAGDSFHGGAETAHYSWNAGKTTIQFILVEKYK